MFLVAVIVCGSALLGLQLWIDYQKEKLRQETERRILGVDNEKTN